VRCDKQRPQCSRCIRIGNACRYSVSMRTGKPAIDFVKAFNAGMLPPQRSIPTTSQSSATTMTVADLQPMDMDQSLWAILQGQTQGSSSSSSSGSTTKSSTPPSTDPVPSPGHIFQDQELNLEIELGPTDTFSPFPVMPHAQVNKMGHQSGHSTSSSSDHQMDVDSFKDYFYNLSEDHTQQAHSPGFSISIPPPMDFDFISPFDLLESEPRMNDIASPGSMGHGNDGHVPVDPSLQHSHIPSSGHSCLRTTKALKQSVLTIAAAGEMAARGNGMINGSPPTTTTDHAMLICSSITKQLIEILQCRCEADAYLPFLITVIVSKLLATYGAIARIDDLTAFSLGNSPQLQHEREQEMQAREQIQLQDAFMSVPLRLGTYDVDGKLEGVLRAQLVLFELSRLECVVQLFGQKYCHQSPRDERQSEDRNIYSALGQFIMDRFARIKAQCEIKSATPTQGI
jgi:hypothetical protein